MTNKEIPSFTITVPQMIGIIAVVVLFVYIITAGDVV